MKKTQSVATQIIALLTLGILIYSVCLFFVIHRELNVGFESFFENELEPQSNVITQEFNGVLNKLEKTVNWAKNTYESQYSYYSKGTDNITTLAYGATQYFDAFSFCIFDNEGHQLTPLNLGIIHNDELVRRVLRGETISEIYKDGNNLFAINGKPVIHNGKQIGAVVGNEIITTDELIDYIASYTNCDVTVFNGNRRGYTSIPGMKASVITDEEPILNAKAGQKTVLRTKIGDKNYLAYYFPLHDPKGNFLTTLYLGRSLSVVQQVTSGIFTPLLIFAIIFTIILLGTLIALITIKIIVPLKNVGNAVESLSSGEADLTIRLPVKGKDEFAKLSDDVNKFIELLQNIVRQLLNAQDSLVTIGENLGQNSQSSASATAEIMANIESVRKQSESQTDAVGNTSNVLKKSTEAVEELGTLIERQTSGIADSSAAIEEMLGNISSVTNSVRKMSESFATLSNTVNVGSRKMENVNEKVAQMAEQSKMLLQANEMIAAVAEQTNLLAMNAAIEAAHAGDAGKGFSVVADEIRKLAETSSDQSKNIDVELKGISESIQDVVSLSQDSQSAFGEIVTHLGTTDAIIHQIDHAMSEQEQASHQILSSLSDMRQKSDQVNVKSVELNEGVQLVLKDMASVSQISDVILGSMDEMTTGAKEINGSTQSVSNLALQTNENINAMNQLLNQFKI
ncbi:MAG: methyl-accepting chemotaxis protein [Treponema sp.]|nr:methyl-accepting chemotaxis protein [Treponema sp.]